MVNIHRRGLLLGLASALAAPAIVHAGNLMPIKAFDFDTDNLLVEATERYAYAWTDIRLGYAIMREAINKNLYGDFTRIRQAWGLEIDNDLYTSQRIAARTS